MKRRHAGRRVMRPRRVRARKRLPRVVRVRRRLVHLAGLFRSRRSAAHRVVLAIVLLAEVLIPLPVLASDTDRKSVG